MLRIEPMSRFTCFFWFAFFYLVSLSPFYANAGEKPDELQGVGISEHLGERVKIEELHFQDEWGNPVALSTYFNQGRPILLALVYFECPSLCNLILKGLLDSLKEIEWTTGREFELVAVSINPNEKPSLALAKKTNYLKSYNRPEGNTGWHFLTGEEDQIHALAAQIGFEYRYIEQEKQYAHAAAIYLLTPQGKISRYLYGTLYKPNNLRIGLSEAANGRVGTVMDRVLLFCFHFDPSKNSYTLKVWRVVQLVLALQVLVGGSLLFALWRADKRKIKKEFKAGA